MIDMETIDPSFGHWLAGFIDAEAHFAIDKVGTSYQCRMALSLRSDDREILEEIKELTGLGTIYEWTTRANPAVKWSVANRRDTLRLVMLLERFPLRSKKLRDFEIWSQAVVLSQSHHSERDKQSIVDLSIRIQEVRRFS